MCFCYSYYHFIGVIGVYFEVSAYSNMFYFFFVCDAFFICNTLFDIRHCSDFIKLDILKVF